MIEVEVLGADSHPGGPSPREIERLCLLALASAGIERGHLAI
jgi:hypothetical protein